METTFLDFFKTAHPNSDVPPPVCHQVPILPLRQTLGQRCASHSTHYDASPDHFLVLDTRYLGQEFDKILPFVHKCIEEGANLFIHSPLGTSKTGLIQQLITHPSLSTDDTRILAFVMRQSLARSLAERLDLELYLDEEHRNQIHNLFRLIISQESSHKIERNGSWQMPHIAVWDEIRSNVGNVTSTTLEGKRSSYLQKMEAIMSDPRCLSILMDANIDDDLLRVLQTFSRNKPIYHIINLYLLDTPIYISPNLMTVWNFVKRDVEEFEDHWDEVRDQEERVCKKQIVLTFSSLKHLNCFRTHIFKKFEFVKEEDVLVITSESNDKDRRTTGNPERDWAKYFFIMYTSSVLCGVNYDRQDLDVRVYVIATNSMSVTDGIQMAFRARNPKKIIFFAPPVDPNKAPLPSAYKDIITGYHSLKNFILPTIAELIVTRTLRSDTDRTMKIMVDEEAPETQIAIMKIRDRNLSCNNWAAHLISYLVSISRYWHDKWNNPLNSTFRNYYLHPREGVCKQHKKSNILFLKGIEKSNAPEKAKEEEAIIHELSQTPLEEHREKIKADKITIYSCKDRSQKLNDKLRSYFIQYGVIFFRPSYKDLLISFHATMKKPEYQAIFNDVFVPCSRSLLDMCRNFTKDSLLPQEQQSKIMSSMALHLYSIVAPRHVVIDDSLQFFILNYEDAMIKAFCSARWDGTSDKDALKFYPKYSLDSDDLRTCFQEALGFLMQYQKAFGALGITYPRQIVNVFALAQQGDDGKLSFPPPPPTSNGCDILTFLRQTIFDILKRVNIIIDGGYRMRRKDPASTDKRRFISSYRHPVSAETLHRYILAKIQQFREKPEPRVGEISRYIWVQERDKLEDLIKGWTYYPLFYESATSMELESSASLSLSLDLFDEGSSS